MRILAVLLIWVGAGLALGQTPPTVYTIKEVNGFLGQPGVKLIIYRNGSKVAFDHPKDDGGLTRSLMDLDTHQNLSFDVRHTENGCSTGKFGGDWGDPFAMTAEVTKDAKTVGNETVNGMAAKVMEAPIPTGGKVKSWLDGKTGLVLRAQVTDASGKVETLIDVQEATFVAPPNALFEIPPSCQAALHPPVDPDFEVATTAPASEDACVVWLRVVKAGSMETINGGFRMGIDLAINTLHPQQHTVGQGPDGKGVFGGGGIREMSGQFKDGVLRLGRIGKMFDIESVFDNNRGFASGMMYRKCFGPQTMLLMVIKDPNNIGKGVDYLWDKKGKYLPTSAGGN